jgi:hypothetical protein
LSAPEIPVLLMKHISEFNNQVTIFKVLIYTKKKKRKRKKEKEFQLFHIYHLLPTPSTNKPSREVLSSKWRSTTITITIVIIIRIVDALYSID